MSTNGPLLDIPEAARDVLGLSVHTVRRWVRDRRLPHVRLGRRILFDPAELAAFVKSHRVAVDVDAAAS